GSATATAGCTWRTSPPRASPPCSRTTRSCWSRPWSAPATCSASGWRRRSGRSGRSDGGGAVRILAGKWAGRQLVSPPDRRVRPTAEPVRDAWLRQVDPYLPGARVLDLFAGTGALGLEALSRGAAFADFVETRPSSLHA